MFDVKQGAIVTKDAKGNASVADSESFGAPWGSSAARSSVASSAFSAARPA